MIIFIQSSHIFSWVSVICLLPNHVCSQSVLASSFSFFPNISLLLLCVSVCGCMSSCVPHACRTLQSKGGQWIPRNWSHRHWTLGIGPRFSGRAASALPCFRISPAPDVKSLCIYQVLNLSTPTCSVQLVIPYSHGIIHAANISHF